jgi:hypothetical protein
MKEYMESAFLKLVSNVLFKVLVKSMFLSLKYWGINLLEN